MTKKDFQLIAATLAQRSRGNGKLAQALHDVIVDDFANALSGTNPRFKRDLFIQAATGQVSVTARKARDVSIALPRATGPRTLASDLAEDR